MRRRSMTMPAVSIWPSGRAPCGPATRTSFGATAPTPGAARRAVAAARKPGARKQSALSSSTASPPVCGDRLVDRRRHSCGRGSQPHAAAPWRPAIPAVASDDALSTTTTSGRGSWADGGGQRALQHGRLVDAEDEDRDLHAASMQSPPFGQPGYPRLWAPARGGTQPADARAVGSSRVHMRTRAVGTVLALALCAPAAAAEPARGRPARTSGRHGARRDRAQRRPLRRHQHDVLGRRHLPGRRAQHVRRPARLRVGLAAHAAARHRRRGHVLALPARHLGGQRRGHRLRRPGQPRQLDPGPDVRGGHRQPQLTAHPALPHAGLAHDRGRRRQRQRLAGRQRRLRGRLRALAALPGHQVQLRRLRQRPRSPAGLRRHALRRHQHVVERGRAHRGCPPEDHRGPDRVRLGPRAHRVPEHGRVGRLCAVADGHLHP